MNNSNNQSEWWRGAVIYQVYPRSFFDSNNDGIGDLPGVTAQLEYIASLNVDAIWLSPFFTSPMKDFGYDIADYRNVDPIFGTLKDLDELIEKAHTLGLKIIIDQVISHTSDQHPWFVESRSSKQSSKADWYVWADGKDDGTPPNNWLSVFGGSAWTWDNQREKYYLHNFLKSQPDLNFHNPEVVNQLLEDIEFWLKRGVDGFRLDAANFYFHDVQLRDNPLRTEAIEEGSIGVRSDNPYGSQQHIYDKSRPENLEFLRKLRQLLDQYPGSTTVGEVGCDQALETMAAYTNGNDKLHMCYSFDLLTPENSAAHIRRTVSTMNESLVDGWPCWSIGNHDVCRVRSRWGHAGLPLDQVKMYMVMQTTLKGSVCMYQGEELALTEAEIPFEDIVDPYGKHFWPSYKGRDGCRTPMPWKGGIPHAGFSGSKPWLPIPPEHHEMAVAEQEGDKQSALEAYRDFLAWRRQQPVLVSGDLEFIGSSDECLLYTRTLGDEVRLIALNLSDQDQTLAFDGEWVALDLPISCSLGRQTDQGAQLPPYGVLISMPK